MRIQTINSIIVFLSAQLKNILGSFFTFQDFPLCSCFSLITDILALSHICKLKSGIITLEKHIWAFNEEYFLH